MTCAHCGARNPDNSPVCLMCGENPRKKEGVNNDG